MSTPTPASIVPATQPLAYIGMRSKHPIQGYTAQCGLECDGNTTPVPHVGIDSQYELNHEPEQQRKNRHE